MIQMEQIQVEWKQQRVLQAISLNIHAGLHYGFLGPNGAGKSTLLKILCGDIQPNQGDVNWFGRSLKQWKSSEIAKRRAILPQKTDVGLPFSGSEILEMGRYPHFDFQPTAKDKAILAFVAEWMELTPLLKKPYQTLSGGEQQRLLLGKAICQLLEEPSLDYLEGKVLLLDEPTNNLDLFHQIHSLNLLEACQKKGLTILTIFHDLNLASRYCQQLILLKDGQIQAHGTPASVLTTEQIFTTFRVDADVDSSGIHPHIFIPTIHTTYQWKHKCQPSALVLKS